MNPQFAKAYLQKGEKADEQNGVLGEAIISNGTVDRDGDILDPKGFDFKNFKNNPVLLWSHNSGFGEQRPSIGKVIKTWVSSDGNVKFIPQFDLDDEFARMIFNKFKKGFLNAFSVGFQPLEFEEIDTGLKFNKMEALEFSAVNVPANPEALVTMRSEGISVVKSWKDWKIQNKQDKEIQIANDIDVNVADAKEALLHYDGTLPDAIYADDKGELPLGSIVDGEPKIVFSLVKHSMAKLLGAEGGVDLDSEKRRIAYKRIASYYEKFSRVAPNFKHADTALYKVAEGKKQEEKKIEDVKRAIRLDKKTLIIKALKKLAE